MSEAQIHAIIRALPVARRKTAAWHHDLVDAVQLTIADAAPLLEPPLPERGLRDIVRALGWQAAGWRQTGRKGHPTALYDWADLCALHAALAPFLKG